jgi:UDP-glucose 4-epimerase
MVGDTAVKKILLFGGCGFIGTNLAQYMARLNYRIIIYDLHEGPNKINHPNVTYIIGSINSKNFSELLCSAECIIYSASKITPSSKVNLANAIHSELSGLEKIFELIKNKDKKFVYLSSGGAVYGDATPAERSETDLCKPKSAYGIVKYSAELFIASELRDAELNYVIVRPSNPYGPYHNPVSSQGVVSIFINKILRGEEIIIYGDPDNIVKDYIYIDDFSESIRRICESDINKLTINIGSSVGTSLSNIINIMRSQIGSEFKIRYEPGLHTDIHKYILSIEVAKSLLGWAPATSIDDGIRKTICWVKDKLDEEARGNSAQ